MMINDESFDSLVFLCVQFMAKLDVLVRIARMTGDSGLESSSQSLDSFF